MDKAKDGKHEWNPKLATVSEQDVRSDETKMSMEEMEKLGAEEGEEDAKKAGKV